MTNHTMTGLLGTLSGLLRMTNTETLVLTDYVTDQDETGPTKLWSAQYLFKRRRNRPTCTRGWNSWQSLSRVLVTGRD